MTRKAFLFFLFALSHCCAMQLNDFQSNELFDKNLDDVELNQNIEPATTAGLLYPRESETRDVRTLNGMWNFVKSDVNDPMQGVREKWFEKELEKVCSSAFKEINFIL